MKTFKRYGFLLLILAISLFLSGCFSSKTEKRTISTVDGPEGNDLINNIKGTIIYPVSIGGISAVTFPDRSETIVRKSHEGIIRSGFDAVYILSNPDQEGRVAFIEESGAEQHLLKYITIDGSKTETVFTKPKSVWGTGFTNQPVGNYLALSPQGGLVAFVSNLKRARETKDYVSNYPKERSASLEFGDLEIWNIGEKKQLKIDARAVNKNLSWFPDHQKIAYTVFVPRQDLKDQNFEPGAFGKIFKDWLIVPSVYIYDLSNNSNKFFHIGWNPIVSPDGKNILMSDTENNFILVDIQTKQSRPIDWPGKWGEAIGFADPNTIIYYGLPTTGIAPTWTKYGSMGAWSTVAIKVADIKNDKFQTLLYPIDPRVGFTYGDIK